VEVPAQIDCAGGTDIATLVVAIVGAVTGLLALAWQAVTYFLSGARFRVELVSGWVGPSGAFVGTPGTFEASHPPSSSLNEACLGVKVTNVGRLPLTVTSWSIGIGPAALGLFANQWNKPVPHRLEVGEPATWFVASADVSRAAYALRNQKDIRIRAQAAIAGRKSRESKRQLRYPEDVGRFLPAPVTKS
jgi:hypothetical protein